MKILMLAKIDSSHTKKWALALKKEGVAVALFSIHRPNKDDDWYKQMDVVYFPDKDIASSGILAKLNYIILYFSLKKLIKIFKPDILHSHFATHYSFLANLMRFKKHLITVWGSDVFVFPKKRKLNELIFKYNLSRANAIISTSDAMATEVMKYTSKKVSVIPFGIDMDLFTPKLNKNDSNEIIIGNIKSLEPIYGIDVLIEAFKLIKTKLPALDLKLVIVGKGSKLNEYQKLVSDLNLQKHVEFKGSVTPEQVPEILKTFSVFACLSRNESFGVSVIEAMACKIPVVVTKTPGFLEVVSSEKNGLFAEIDSASDAADKIIQLITDEHLADKNINDAFIRAKRLYNLNDNIKQQIELYKSVLQ